MSSRVAGPRRWPPRRRWTDLVPAANSAGDVPTGFLEVLKAFDSHERGILFHWASGSPFSLSPLRREKLFKTLGTPVPEKPFMAMDYTLDWLHAALTCYLDPTAWSTPRPLTAPAITGSQEDVDLLLAWEDQALHLPLIKTKGLHGLVEQADGEQGQPARSELHARPAGPWEEVGPLQLQRRNAAGRSSPI